MNPLALRICTAALTFVAFSGCSQTSRLSTVRGELRLAGGDVNLSAPVDRPLMGTVQVHEGALVFPEQGNPSFGRVVATAQTGSDGHFTVTVPSPGKYVLTGTSPGFNGGTAVCWSVTVVVANSAPATADIACQAK